MKSDYIMYPLTISHIKGCWLGGAYVLNISSFRRKLENKLADNQDYLLLPHQYR